MMIKAFQAYMSIYRCDGNIIALFPLVQLKPKNMKVKKIGLT